MFDKERFHNVLALSLGYEHIVKDKFITIEMEDSDAPWVTLTFQDNSKVVRFKAFGEADAVEAGVVPELQSEVKVIVDAVHKAYQEACNSRF